MLSLQPENRCRLYLIGSIAVMLIMGFVSMGIMLENRDYECDGILRCKSNQIDCNPPIEICYGYACDDCLTRDHKCVPREQTCKRSNLYVTFIVLMSLSFSWVFVVMAYLIIKRGCQQN